MTEQAREQSIEEPATEAQETVERQRAAAFFVPIAEWSERRPNLAMEGDDIAASFNELLEQLPPGTRVTSVLPLANIPGVKEGNKSGSIVFVFRE